MLADLTVGGEALPGAISRLNSAGTFRFRGQRASTYRIETQGYTRVQLSLYGPDERTGALRFDDSADRDTTPDLVNRQLRVRLQPGTYFVEVRHADSGGIGEYRIRVIDSGRDEKTTTSTDGASLPTIDTSKKSRRLALLVGIDDYQAGWIGDLHGCVSDVEDVRDLLVRNFSFVADDVLVLTNGQATHANIVEAFRRHLVQRAERDAVTVFQFSGHGSQMLDDEGGDESFDGLDETIVPCDSRTGPDKFDLRDDELNGLFRELRAKTEHVTFILDSCHSGSGIRGTGVPRRIEADDRIPPPAQPWEVSTRGVRDRDARFEDLDYVLIAGCQDKELSFELELSGLRRGAMTFYLTKAIREANRVDITYQDIMEQVKASVTRENPAQHPQIEGRLTNNLVFGTACRETAPYVLASHEAEAVILQAGRVHGLAPGSRFAVFPPNASELGDPGKAVAEVELTRVDVLTSAAKVVKGAFSDIQPQSRAVEIERAYSIEPFSVHFLSPDEARDYRPLQDLTLRSPVESPLLQAVQEKIQDRPHFKLVGDVRQARLLLADAAGEVHVLRSSGEEVKATNRSTADLIVQEIEHWAKWHNLLVIENRRSERIRVTVEVAATDGHGSRDVTETDRVPMLRFAAGDQIRFTVKNEGQQPFFFTILDLSSDGSVAVVYPASGDQSALLPNRQTACPVEAFVPDAVTEITDYIKVIATTAPVDFKFVELEGIKSRAEDSKDPLTRLIEEAAAQSKAKGDRTTPVADWATADAVFRVVK